MIRWQGVAALAPRSESGGRRTLVVFEDQGWRALRPLTDLLPVPALRFGASDLAGRWHLHTGLPIMAIAARPEAMACWREAPRPEAARAESQDELVVVNAAALPGPWLGEAMAARSPALWVSGERVAGARVSFPVLAARLEGGGSDFETFLRDLDLPTVPVLAEWLTHPWDLVERNADAIRLDLEPLHGLREGEVHRLAALEEPERITIEPGARVDAYAVLDARPGPIHLAAGAEVLPHTVVTGPCAVGQGTQLLGGSIGFSSIGPVCRILGEVDSSLWQGWANKRHHGFVGHSVVGEWVNLGALTTTSDLKNNYGEVRVWVDGAERPSGLRKIGAFLGAHVRTGIGTLLPTGVVVGVGSNLFGGGRFAPKHVPAFAWWDGGRVDEHRLEKFMETARLAMARRERPLSSADETALRALFDATAADRAAARTA